MSQKNPYHFHTRAMKNAINIKTRFIYLETIGSPKMNVSNLVQGLLNVGQ